MLLAIPSLSSSGVTLVLSGSQYILSSCLCCILRRADKRLCCSTKSRLCNPPLGGTSHSSQPCLCCRTHEANFHCCCCSPPIGMPGTRNLICCYSQKDQGLHCFLSCRTVYHSFHRGFLVRRASRRSCRLVSGKILEKKLMQMKAPWPPLGWNKLLRSTIQG